MESPKLIVILLTVLGAMWIPAQGASIEQRNLINFAHVIDCVNLQVGKLRYADYGCFCGPGGNGNQPVDDIDRCCQVHDDCYGEAEKMGCYPIFTLYDSCCVDGIPKCPDTWPTSSKCGKKVCTCDVEAAVCFKKHSDKFNTKLEDYNQKHCKTI
ncbi:basic phospholipase A2-like [Mustelus asterias]